MKEFRDSLHVRLPASALAPQAHLCSVAQLLPPFP
jgi:hypothetical protein